MSGFIRNTAKILSGNVAVFVIGIAALPLLTRLYDPEIFGKLIIFNSLVSLFTPLAGLGYEKAILLPKNTSTAYCVFQVSILSTLFISVILFILALFSAPLIAELIGYTGEQWVLLLVPVGVFLMATIRCYRFWAIRQNKFNAQVISSIAAAILEKSSAVIAGLFSFALAGLMSARISGLILAFYLLKIFLQDTQKTYFSKYRLTKFRVIIKNYLHFILSALSAFLNSASREAPPILLSMLYSPSIAGYYGLARAAVGMPLMQLSDAITRSTYHRISQAVRKNESVGDKILAIYTHLLALLSPPLILLAFVGDKLVPFIFGENWSDAGAIIEILGVYFIFAVIYRPISTIFDIFELQRQRLIFNILLVLGSLSGILIGAVLNDYKMSLMMFTLINSAFYTLALIYLNTKSGNSFLTFIVSSLKRLLPIFILVGLPAWLAGPDIDNKILLLIFSFILLFLYYTYYLVINRHQIRNRLKI